MWRNILAFVIAVCLATQLAEGQKGTVKVTGMVITRDNVPVAWAAIFVDNIRTGKFTDENGNFSLKISSTARNLRIESDKYGSLEKPVNAKSKMNFVLGAIADSASSAPVIAENEKGKKRSEKLNSYNDIYQMIRSEVPGVVVNGKSIVIKQGHSFFGSSTPLFVINGVVVPSIDNVNPREVKSINVLTGSSAAIYGIRGSNGVLSITLKNGSEEKNTK